MTGAAKPTPPPVVRHTGSRLAACFPAATPPTVTSWADDAFAALQVVADEDGAFSLVGVAEPVHGQPAHGQPDPAPLAPSRVIARFAGRDDALAALASVVEVQRSAPPPPTVAGRRRGERLLQAFTATCLATITVGLIGGWSGLLTGGQNGSCLSGGDPDAVAAMIAAAAPPPPAPRPPPSPPPASIDLGAFDVEKVMEEAAQTSSRIRSRLIEDFVAQNPQIFNRPAAPAATPVITPTAAPAIATAATAAGPAEGGFTAFGLGTPPVPSPPSP